MLIFFQNKTLLSRLFSSIHEGCPCSLGSPPPNIKNCAFAANGTQAISIVPKKYFQVLIIISFCCKGTE